MMNIRPSPSADLSTRGPNNQLKVLDLVPLRDRDSLSPQPRNLSAADSAKLGGADNSVRRYNPEPRLPLGLVGRERREDEGNLPGRNLEVVSDGPVSGDPTLGDRSDNRQDSRLEALRCNLLSHWSICSWDNTFSMIGLSCSRPTLASIAEHRLVNVGSSLFAIDQLRSSQALYESDHVTDKGITSRFEPSRRQDEMLQLPKTVKRRGDEKTGGRSAAFSAAKFPHESDYRGVAASVLRL
jgi:hypothetical protein